VSPPKPQISSALTDYSKALLVNVKVGLTNGSLILAVAPSMGMPKQQVELVASIGLSVRQMQHETDRIICFEAPGLCREDQVTYVWVINFLAHVVQV